MTREEILGLFKTAKEKATKVVSPHKNPSVQSTLSIKSEMGVDYPMVFDAADGAVVRRDKLNKLSKIMFDKDDTLIKVWEAEANALTSESYATQPHGEFVRIYTSNGDGSFDYIETTDYSSLHWDTEVHNTASTAILDVIDEGDTQEQRVIDEGDIQVARVIAEGDTQEGRAYVEAKNSEAEAMTADSYANESEDVLVKHYYYDQPTDTILYNDVPDTYSAFHWLQKSIHTGSGLTYRGTWDSVDCSMPPDDTENGALYIVRSVTGDTSTCPTLTVGDWLIWSEADDGGDDTWHLINWTFDWSAITNIPDNVVNAITQVELDTAIATREPTITAGNDGEVYTSEGGDKVWKPAPISLPDATGKAFNELATDGSASDSAEWSPFRMTPNTISEDYTIKSGSTAIIGSFELSDGNTITIEDGAKLVVL